MKRSVIALVGHVDARPLIRPGGAGLMAGLFALGFEELTAANCEAMLVAQLADWPSSKAFEDDERLLR